MKTLQSKSNIANKVRNTNLPRTKPLLPLFEVVSNSIHAINEASKAGVLKGGGEITVTLIRNGDAATLAKLEKIDEYPIHSFEIVDNGIGLNDNNINHYVESDTDHKINMGGKGVGRFVALKAFYLLDISSIYLSDNGLVKRTFIFKATKEGFHDYQETLVQEGEIGTRIALTNFRDEYRRNSPRDLLQIAKELVTHFQLYYINDEAPKIFIRNQNDHFVDCQNYFDYNLKSGIVSQPFKVGDSEFELFLTKSLSALSHKLHFCAHNRSVKEEGLINRIVDLGKYAIMEDSGSFYYQAFVVGKVLDDNVTLERISFTFPTDDSDDTSPEELTLSKIRKEAINTIELLLEDYLNAVRNKKLESYTPVIKDELPQYNYLLNHKLADIRRLPPNLTKEKLDIELYKIDTDWKQKVKAKGVKLLEEKVDIHNLENYKNRYNEFLEEFNEVGKSDLARYIVHRRTVIELLEHLLEKNDQDKFSDEDLLHSIFFPIRSASDEIPYDKQNLWLLDERLNYHSFLASDKQFQSIKQLESNSADRADLIIYNDAIAFAENKKAPFQSFTIVEFKKPQRNDYQDYDSKKNPLDQVEKYIREILSGKVEGRDGRKIMVDSKMPFYVYIVCDLSETLIRILESREFDKTPDGQGYFKFYSRYYNAYIEVLPFEKVLSDAKKRNRVLFERLGIRQ